MSTSSTEYTGHDQTHRGLQRHSLGGAYPLAIVAYDSNAGVVYTIENLAEGTVCCAPNGLPRQYSVASLATAVLDAVVTGARDVLVQGNWFLIGDSTWKPGRPVFDDLGTLRV